MLEGINGSSGSLFGAPEAALFNSSRVPAVPRNPASSRDRAAPSKTSTVAGGCPRVSAQGVGRGVASTPTSSPAVPDMSDYPLFFCSWPIPSVSSAPIRTDRA
ncbi:uncharacterized protein LY79DRAFT_537780 [Colletotrichum navitas]|uniref:Uncharacterized protein n=1 Tax=Colletotrichum navitas TaxID=681940 RepID=A0AAD8QAE1_9PEZI|nr:uncharacterized protein LY79DRAFT_537780 [Colletotrichum navitas]KAK1598660.1 hypothetical protein LY79DRAFT_537780 [Colletotrichum navitas]